LYTTLDILLHPLMTREKLLQDRVSGSGSESTTATILKVRNMIFEEVPVQAMNALCDLLIWQAPAGVRFRPRDQLAHAGICPANIPYWIGELTFSIVIYFALRYDPYNYGKGYISQCHPTIQKCHKFVSEYVPCLHPKTIVYKRIYAIYQKWQGFKVKVVEDVMPPEKNLKKRDNPISVESHQDKKYQEQENGEGKLLVNEEKDKLKQEKKKQKKEAKEKRKLEFLELNQKQMLWLQTLNEQFSDMFANRLKYETLFTFSHTNNKIFDISPLKWVNSEVSGNQTVFLTNVDVLVSYADQLIEEITKTYFELKEMVVEHTAWKRHRDNFQELQTLKSYFYCAIGLIMQIAEAMLWCVCDTSEGSTERSLLSTCWKVCLSLLSSAHKNKWRHGWECFNCFVAPNSSFPVLLLSKREIVTFYGDLGQYFKYKENN